MSKKSRRRVIIGCLLIVLGTTLAMLPKDWIEQTIGADPDAGSGLLEFAITVVPLAVGIALFMWALVIAGAARRAARSEQPQQGAVREVA